MRTPSRSGLDSCHRTQCMSRRLVALVGAIGLLAAGAAGAVTIPDDVYVLPVDAADATTVDLGLAAPFPGTPTWVRARPTDPTDTVQDYTSSVTGSKVSGPAVGTPGNPEIFDITFTVTWNGGLDGSTVADPVAEDMLFAIVDSRYGDGMTLASTTDLPQSGFVRGSFAVNGTPLADPEIVQDAPFGGFLNDGFGNRFVGFFLPATPNATQTITMQWAMGQAFPGPEDVFFPNALFLAVPEPAALTLLGVGALGIARLRRGRGEPSRES